LLVGIFQINVSKGDIAYKAGIYRAKAIALLNGEVGY
jgi:hypothetical protein